MSDRFTSMTREELQSSLQEREKELKELQDKVGDMPIYVIGFKRQTLTSKVFFLGIVMSTILFWLLHNLWASLTK